MSGSEELFKVSPVAPYANRVTYSRCSKTLLYSCRQRFFFLKPFIEKDHPRNFFVGPVENAAEAGNYLGERKLSQAFEINLKP